jgi:hypothetical protein
MKLLFFVSLFVFILYFSDFAQEKTYEANIDYAKLYKSVLNEYGFDQVLVNGILYEDLYWRRVGHQFLLDDQFYKGNLKLNGKLYKDIEMKYDIYDQQLIINVKQNNSIASVVPSIDFVSNFSFGGKSFSKYSFSDVPGYYQVVFESEKMKCLYFWFKEKHDSNKINYSGFNEFTESEKKNYLILNGALKKYKNNGSFTDLFSNKIRAQIRKYIRSNNLDVAKSSDESIMKLLTYCNSLL